MLWAMGVQGSMAELTCSFQERDWVSGHAGTGAGVALQMHIQWFHKVILMKCRLTRIYSHVEVMLCNVSEDRVRCSSMQHTVSESQILNPTLCTSLCLSLSLGQLATLPDLCVLSLRSLSVSLSLSLSLSHSHSLSIARSLSPFLPSNPEPLN